MPSRTQSQSKMAPHAGAGTIPLPALLSQVLVAFIIEFDNEAEHRMPHRTTDHGSKADSLPAPWLVSLAMWENCMRYVGEKGISVCELGRLARTTTNLNGMERWGYIVVAPDPSDRRPKPPRRDWLIRATPAGRKAQEIWQPLFGVIEKRWQERFGEEAIAKLRETLATLVRGIDAEVPDCPPILGYGLACTDGEYARRAPTPSNAEDGSNLNLSALLSRVLLAFAIEFERESDLSIAVSANVVRVLNETGVRVRDLPRISGISKELIKVALGFLQKRGNAVIVSDAAAKATKLARLTPKGLGAQSSYQKLTAAIEKRWQVRFGKDFIHDLRNSLEQLVGDANSKRSPLWGGLAPHPHGWRASVPKPYTLPHYPMVTHRGGFPDGS